MKAYRNSVARIKKSCNQYAGFCMFMLKKWISSRNGLFFLKVRKLYQHNCRKHQNTSEKLTSGERLVENHPSCKNGENGFQTHQKGSCCRIQSFLADDLQCIANPRGENSGIENRHPGVQKIGEKKRWKRSNMIRRSFITAAIMSEFPISNAVWH